MNIKKEFEKLWQYEMDLIDNPVNFTYLHKMCLRINRELLDKQKEEIWEKANAYDEDGEPVKIFWS